MQLAVEPTDQIQLAHMPKIALRVRGLNAAGDDDTDERKTGVGDQIGHAPADSGRVDHQLAGWRAPVSAQRRRRHHDLQPVYDIHVAEAAHTFEVSKIEILGLHLRARAEAAVPFPFSVVIEHAGLVLDNRNRRPVVRLRQIAADREARRVALQEHRRRLRGRDALHTSDHGHSGTTSGCENARSMILLPKTCSSLQMNSHMYSCLNIISPSCSRSCCKNAADILGHSSAVTFVRSQMAPPRVPRSTNHPTSPSGVERATISPADTASIGFTAATMGSGIRLASSRTASETRE